MKLTIIAIVSSVVLVVFSILVSSPSVRENEQSINNVSVVDGVQVVLIKAKGGYFPKRSIAKAGTPTIIKFDTKGTFDCSSSVRIPSMDISRVLPSTGKTEINIGSQEKGILRGSCGMGMYPFEIVFE